MRRLACAVGVALLLAAPAIAQAPDPQFLITPGVGIGPLRIGMSITLANAVMGTPRSTQRTKDGKVIYKWSEDGLYVECSASGEILVVTAHYDPRYRTVGGAHTGVTEQEVRAVMGAPLSTFPVPGILHVLIYDGVRFAIIDLLEMQGYQTVVEIAVFQLQN